MVFNASYLENKHGDPSFYGYLAKVDLYLISWYV